MPPGRVGKTIPHAQERRAMKITTFYAMSTDKLDRQVNAFLDQVDVEVVDVQFAASAFYFAVMVRYQDRRAT
jgi:hypothetical protein